MAKACERPPTRRFTIGDDDPTWAGWSVSAGKLTVETDGAFSALRHRAPGEGKISYLLAPQSVVGRLSNARAISYQLKAIGSSYSPGTCGDIVVRSTQGVAITRIANLGETAWREVRVSLTDAQAWELRGASLLAILASATSLELRAELGPGTDDVAFAEFRLE
jgi:hypothetical protein